LPSNFTFRECDPPFFELCRNFFGIIENTALNTVIIANSKETAYKLFVAVYLAPIENNDY